MAPPWPNSPLPQAANTLSQNRSPISVALSNTSTAHRMALCHAINSSRAFDGVTWQQSLSHRSFFLWIFRLSRIQHNFTDSSMLTHQLILCVFAQKDCHLLSVGILLEKTTVTLTPKRVTLVATQQPSEQLLLFAAETLYLVSIKLINNKYCLQHTLYVPSTVQNQIQLAILLTATSFAFYLRSLQKFGVCAAYSDPTWTGGSSSLYTHVHGHTWHIRSRSVLPSSPMEPHHRH